jgi:hypothetical protein
MGDPADLRLGAFRLVDAQDGHAALFARLVGIAHRGAEENLVAAVVHGRVGDFGDLEALGEKTNAPVDLAQALLAVEVVAVLGAVAVLGGPVHRLDDPWGAPRPSAAAARRAGARSRRG